MQCALLDTPKSARPGPCAAPSTGPLCVQVYMDSSNGQAVVIEIVVRTACTMPQADGVFATPKGACISPQCHPRKGGGNAQQLVITSATCRSL